MAENTRSGRWSLNRSRTLTYRRDGDRETAALKAEILSVEPRAMIVALEQTQRDQNPFRREIRVEGQWRTDARNRLVFIARGARGDTDTLTFEGEWRSGAGGLAYVVRTTSLKTRKTTERALRFSGSWNINDDRQIVYRLEPGADSDGSFFRFRGAFQTGSVLAKAGRIRYQLGVEGRSGSALTIFGKWKFGRDVSLEFETERVGSKKQSLRFGAVYHFDEESRLSASVLHQGRPLGFEVEFSKNVRGGAEAFLRFKRPPEESRIEAGVKLAW